MSHFTYLCTNEKVNESKCYYSVESTVNMAKLLRDFPTGPLDYYRKLATFDWKKLKVFLDTEEIIEYEVKQDNTHLYYVLFIIFNFSINCIMNYSRILCSIKKFRHLPLKNRGTWLLRKCLLYVKLIH